MQADFEANSAPLIALILSMWPATIGCSMDKQMLDALNRHTTRNAKDGRDPMFPGILGLLIDSIKHITFPKRAFQTYPDMLTLSVRTE